MGIAQRAPKLAAGVVIDGRYSLVEKLGSGGMGSVWRARHLTLDIDVALKFMSPRLARSKELRERFKREAKAAARLRTRHVARVIDHGVDGALPYIALELLEGEDLRQRLIRQRRFEPVELVELVDQIALGLQCAHEDGVVHRDLKPSNVFLAEEDGRVIAKLLDFGVAKASIFVGDAELTETGVMLGSARYMSPEQARSTREVDPRSDLWSLAVIVYQCLTGRHPFGADDVADAIARIRHAALIPPSEYLSTLPTSLDAFFSRALARDLERRFSTASEFAREFRAASGLDAITLPIVVAAANDTAVVGDDGRVGDTDSAETSGAGDGETGGSASPSPLAILALPRLPQPSLSFERRLTERRDARAVRRIVKILGALALGSLLVGTFVVVDARDKATPHDARSVRASEVGVHQPDAASGEPSIGTAASPPSSSLSAATSGPSVAEESPSRAKSPSPSLERGAARRNLDSDSADPVPASALEPDDRAPATADARPDLAESGSSASERGASNVGPTTKREEPSPARTDASPQETGPARTPGSRSDAAPRRSKKSAPNWGF